MTELRCKLLVVAAVWVSFLLVSFVAAPIPAVNEPHYLTMSRHYWNPSWCAGDFFLNSFAAHRVFYQTFGWLTLWFELKTVAMIGRMISLAMLATSWTSLVSRMHRGELVVQHVLKSEAQAKPLVNSTSHALQASMRDSSCAALSVRSILLSAWLFLGLQAIGNLSGEWLVGGVESKVFAYAFVFWSISAILGGRMMLASLCCGAAVSFHPIVGVWHLLGISFVGIWRCWQRRSEQPRLRPAFRLSHLLGGVCVAIPGLVPALQMLRSVEPRESFAANYIQVFYRLKHHLDPMDFGWTHFAGYGLLAAMWFGAMMWLRRNKRLSDQDGWWIGYVVALALFAIGGLVAGLGPRPADLMPGYRWRVVLLKFYPFRLFDLMLPIAVAIILPRIVRLRWLWCLGGIGFLWAAVEPRVCPPPNQLPPAMRADWRDVCVWVEKNSPTDAVFHTPYEAEAFKWFAQRGEYVNHKDCPQDAAGIVEWNARLRRITKWSEKSFAGDETYSADELRELVRQTGVRFAITRTRVRYDADLLYSNESYKILKLPEIDPDDR